MEKITFKNLHHISELKDVQNKLNKNIKNPGIYIWGYVVDNKLSEILEIKDTTFNANTMKFIPYYIGLDSNLFNRINKHKKFDKGDARKYTRMSEEYMLKFFKDCKNNNFPIKNDDKDIHKEYLKLNDSKEKENITYYNNSDFLTETYGNECIVNHQKKTEMPITKFNEDNGYIINDSLMRIYDYSNKSIHKNNLWFSYALFTDSQDFINCKLEDFEALTFYSLKGKTISKTKKIDNISKNIQVCYEANELENIFKCNNINRSIIEKKYIKDKKVIFEGY